MEQGAGPPDFEALGLPSLEIGECPTNHSQTQTETAAVMLTPPSPVSTCGECECKLRRKGWTPSRRWKMMFWAWHVLAISVVISM